MKITEVKVRETEILLKEPFRIALGTVSVARAAFVEIRTDEGISGYGEGAPCMFVNGDTLEGTKKALELMGNTIVGVDPMDIERIHREMDDILVHNSSAKAAVDIAIYDLIGKISQRPLYKVLGGYGDSFVTDMTVGIDRPEIMARKAKEAVDNGFDTIKTKVGTSFDADIERVRSIRQAVGNDIKIRVDANQSWNPKEAIRTIEKMAEFGIELVEQPVPAFDFEGLAQVTRSASVPIMADESVFDSKDALRIVQMRAADIINIKLMKCGGIREALKINAIAESAGIECMLGCMAEESNVGITAAASLGAAMKNITRGDLDATLFLSGLYVEGGANVAGGKITFSDLPGLGLKN